jgi:hypothetical protein
LLKVSNLWDWSDGCDKDISDSSSQALVIFGTCIGDNGTDISLDLGDVHDGVGENLFEKSDWILEDLGPYFDSFDIWRFAVLDIGIDGSDHLSDDRDTLDDVHDVFLLEVTDGFNKFSIESFSILEAWSNVIEGVVFDKSVEETLNEVGYIGVVDGGNSSDGKHFSDRHSEKFSGLN